MHTPGPWTYEPRSGWISSDACCHRGPIHVADIRGWGHLTGHGHGAHAMPAEEAKAIQDANAALICAAPVLYDALADLVEAVISRDAGVEDYVLQSLFRARRTMASANPAYENRMPADHPVKEP